MSPVAFYADTYYNPDLLRFFNLGTLEYWVPPPNLEVEAILLGGDINYLPEHLGKMVRDIRATQHPDTYIIAVPGNGDYIDQDIEVTPAVSRSCGLRAECDFPRRRRDRLTERIARHRIDAVGPHR
jgi:hypothetical protein